MSQLVKCRSVEIAQRTAAGFGLAGLLAFAGFVPAAASNQSNYYDTIAKCSTALKSAKAHGTKATGGCRDTRDQFIVWSGLKPVSFYFEYSGRLKP